MFIQGDFPAMFGCPGLSPGGWVCSFLEAADTSRHGFNVAKNAKLPCDSNGETCMNMYEINHDKS